MPAAAPVDAAFYGFSDFVVPNETEAAALTGLPLASIEDARRGGDWFLGRGAGTAMRPIRSGPGSRARSLGDAAGLRLQGITKACGTVTVIPPPDLAIADRARPVRERGGGARHPARACAAGGAGEPGVSLRVRDVEPLGPHTLLIGHVGSRPFTAPVSAHTPVVPDDTVFVPLDVERIHLFRQADGRAIRAPGAR